MTNHLYHPLYPSIVLQRYGRTTYLYRSGSPVPGYFSSIHVVTPIGDTAVLELLKNYVKRILAIKFWAYRFSR